MKKLKKLMRLLGLLLLLALASIGVGLTGGVPIPVHPKKDEMEIKIELVESDEDDLHENENK